MISHQSWCFHRSDICNHCTVGDTYCLYNNYRTHSFFTPCYLLFAWYAWHNWHRLFCNKSSSARSVASFSNVEQPWQCVPKHFKHGHAPLSLCSDTATFAWNNPHIGFDCIIILTRTPAIIFMISKARTISVIRHNLGPKKRQMQQWHVIACKPHAIIAKVSAISALFWIWIFICIRHIIPLFLYPPRADRLGNFSSPLAFYPPVADAWFPTRHPCQCAFPKS